MPVTRALARRAERRVANDNGEDVVAMKGGSRNGAALSTGVNDDAILRAALRHFAEHGLGAARAARQQAEAAFFEGDRQAYDWWLGITRTLDRRLAAMAEEPLTYAKPLRIASSEAAPETDDNAEGERDARPGSA